MLRLSLPNNAEQRRRTLLHAGRNRLRYAAYLGVVAPKAMMTHMRHTAVLLLDTDFLSLFSNAMDLQDSLHLSVAGLLCLPLTISRTDSHCTPW